MGTRGGSEEAIILEMLRMSERIITCRGEWVKNAPGWVREEGWVKVELVVPQKSSAGFLPHRLLHLEMQWADVHSSQLRSIDDGQ